MRKPSVFHRLLFISCLAFLASCGPGGDTKIVNLEKTAPPEVAALGGEPVLHFGIGAMLTPKEGYLFYLNFIEYVKAKTGLPVKVLERESYAEVNALLESGNIDVSFICSGPYVSGHDKFGLKLLAAPQAFGRTVYYCYIIVPADSSATRLDDLRGKTFAFTDPESNTGYLVPVYMLSLKKKTPESFFRKVIFTGSHDKAIEAVAIRLADGAAVDSLIYEYMAVRNPSLAKTTRIIVKSQAFAIPPLVARPDLDPAVAEKIRNLALHMHEDEEGRKILAGMGLERFVPIEDSAYDSIRQMKTWIEGQKKGR